MRKTTAWVDEIFNSIQGEGPYVGERQVFLRFQGCDLRCAYCDTPQSLSQGKLCRVESRPGSGEFRDVKNPLGVDEVAEIVENLAAPGTRALSLTGGEPLLQADFILELAAIVNLPFYLETNASHPKEASNLTGVVDVASCDIKLPGHMATPDYEALLQSEIETIRVFYEAGVEVFAKVVLTPNTVEHIAEAASRLAGVSPDIPLILQPVTPRGPIVAPQMEEILMALEAAAEFLEDVRVIPQVHRFLGVL